MSGSMSRHQHPQRVEPSAPPIHMMSQYYCPLPQPPPVMPTTESELRDRSPPPRYEEAIAECWPSSPPVGPPKPTSATLADSMPPQVPPHQTNQVGIPLSPHRRMTRGQMSDSIRDEYDRPSSCNSNKISSPAHSLKHHRSSGQEARRSRSRNSRYGSVSLSDHSDGSHDDGTSSQDTSEDRSRRGVAKRERGSSSKIKKGLRNIAFVIIQILD